MSAELLRRAAAGIRQDATEIPDRTVTDNRVNGVWLNSAYYLTTTPAVALAVADWLDGIAERHSEGPPTELVLHYDGPCEVCEDGGHEVAVCEGCFPTWEGMDGYCVYPCRETKAALAVVRAYLGEAADA